MRNAFVKTLIELAEKDKNIYLLAGDLGFGVLDDFVQKFPQRFINCGVAEQNMMGVAAGLALSGKKVYVYSIIPFVTMRCFEQIRNDVCYQNLDVKIVGVGSGLAYSYLGPTHYALEDIAVLRALPNMTVLSPADPVEAKELTLKSYQGKGPTYLRLNRSGEKILYDFIPNIEIGKPSILKEGQDGAIVATGVCVEMGVEIIEKLKGIGHNFKLISLHTLKPINKEALLEELKDLGAIFTLEEHNIIGGLGSAIAELLMEAGYQGAFERIGIPDRCPSEIGSTQYLREGYGLTIESIFGRVLGKIPLKMPAEQTQIKVENERTIISSKILLDGGDPEETKKAKALLGEINGQTTNPTLISRNPEVKKRIEQGKKFSKEEINLFYKEVVAEIAKATEGPISIEVYADENTTAKEMLKQAREFQKWVRNACVKLPITKEGLKAAKEAVKEDISVNMTLCFSQEQAAAVYAATRDTRRSVFISPFIGRLDDSGENGMNLIENILKMYQKGDGHVLTLAASIRNLDHMLFALNLACPLITVPFRVIKEWKEKNFVLSDEDFNYNPAYLQPILYQDVSLDNDWQDYNIEHELTKKGIERFVGDWKALIK